MIVRVRDWNPVPAVTLQLLHAPHSDTVQPPPPPQFCVSYVAGHCSPSGVGCWRMGRVRDLKPPQLLLQPDQSVHSPTMQSRGGFWTQRWVSMVAGQLPWQPGLMIWRVRVWNPTPCVTLHAPHNDHSLTMQGWLVPQVCV